MHFLAGCEQKQNKTDKAEYTCISGFKTSDQVWGNSVSPLITQSFQQWLASVSVLHFRRATRVLTGFFKFFVGHRCNHSVVNTGGWKWLHSCRISNYFALVILKTSTSKQENMTSNVTIQLVSHSQTRSRRSPFQLLLAEDHTRKHLTGVKQPVTVHFVQHHI